MRRPWRGLGDTLILLYHRVAEPDGPDPWELCVSPTRFAEHLAELAAFSQQTLRRFVQGGSSRRRRHVVITFDDGYRDNWETALPILERFDWPATFFICTEPVRTGEAFWFDRFARAFPGPAELHLNAYFEWQRMSHEQRRQLMERQGLTEPVPTSALPMTPDTVAKMSNHPLVEIGAHTRTHPVLASLPLDEQRLEIGGSKAQLEEWTGRPVELLAYPYGGPETYTGTTRTLAQELGFQCAMTTSSRRARPADDRYTLPRWTVPPLDGDRFAAALKERLY